jgi:hypothetical protein
MNRGDSQSGRSPLATTYLTSNPDSAGSELIPSLVAYARLEYGTHSCRHQWRANRARPQRQATSAATDSARQSHSLHCMHGEDIGAMGQDSGMSAYAAERQF